ncbi:MAG: LD-carboxypeptidase [Holosporaceae bacterium]|jgi:muramoyltetrapeptide carboxypeptidase|nr:LD-carboxypeptidase [Holosporaceae bacterium]
MRKIAGLFLICLLFGCSERVVENKETPVAINDDEEYDEICRRIAKLNMTVVVTGGGIRPGLAVKMKSIADKYGVNIPEYTLINKDIFRGADTDDARLNNFIDAVNSDKEIVWHMRGGYGTSRLIASLNRLPPPSSSKTLIGFCDATSMNIFVSQKWPNWKVIHAPLLIYLEKYSFSKDKFETLLNILENKIDSYEISGVVPFNYKAQTQERVVGRLTGGNLSIIENSLKTYWEIQTDGKILFLEDIYMEPQHIYRMLYHLKEAGKLDNVKALVLGHFHKVKEEGNLVPYLKGFCANLPIPVYITDQFGHGEHNMPLIYNATAELRDSKMIINTSKRFGKTNKAKTK